MRVALVLLAAVPVAASAAPAPDGPPARAAAKPKCFGKTATIVGTKKADRGRRKIVGTKKADVIVAKGGADDIRGGGGDDRICAGSGNDKVDGGSGKDRIDGSGGTDRLKGGAGDDEVKGGAGKDTLDGGRGVDMCDGGKGKNKLRRCEPLPLTGPGGPSGPGGPTGPPGLTRAAPDSATTTEDASTTIAVLANDTGNGLTIKSVDAGTAKAALTIAGASIVYDPRGRLDALPADQSATETFSYTVAAGSGATATGTVTVTVTGIDDAPLAIDDALAADEGKQATLDVLANDTDIDGGPKTIASVDAFGASGTVTIADDGSSLAYTPGIGVCGTTDTFTYTLVTGTTATVTVTIACSGKPPSAADDGATVAEDAPATAIDVLANDSDADGGTMRVLSATDPASGAVVVDEDGSGLTYAPDPNYCNSPPGTALDTFTYTLNGGSTATVAVTVTCVDDAPTAVGDPKTLEEDAAATAVGVLANDTDVDGGPKTVASVTQGAHGAVVITGGGTGLTYKPALNFCGSDSFTYTLNGGSSATVSVTVTCVNDAPVADDESFTGAVGNTPFAVGTTHAEPRKAVAGDVLTGDTDVDSGSLTAQATTITKDSGSVVMEADGQFVYHPAPGFVGTHTFDYTVTDGDKTDTGQVSITVAGRVWYVDAAAAAGGDGTGAKPFNSLASLNNAGSDVDQPGEHIFLLGGAVAGALALENTQQLRSRSVGLNIGGLIVTASGANPSVAGVTLASGNAIQGVDLLGPLTGTNFGTASVNTERTGVINSSGGPAINLDTGTITTALSSVSSANSSGNGIRLNAVNGTLTLPAGAITNAAATDFLVGGGNATITYGGTITDDAGQLVSIANKTGGSVAFSGAISDGNDGDGGGIALSNNDAAPVSFTGGLTLSTGPNEAFAATDGGTVTVTGSANTIDASGGALRVVGTNIGAGGLTFRGIRSVGGSAPGIHLDGTGSAGGLTVTGAGTPGSGGTISGKSGADNTVNGTGVRLDDTRNVSLSRMQLNDHQNYAIRGASVANFSLIDSVVGGANGTNTDVDEGAVRFTELTGSSAITRSTLAGGIYDNLRVVNTGGTLNRLTVDGSTIGLNGSQGNDGILLEATAGTFNVTINGTTFHGARGDHVDHNAVGTSVSDFVFTGNTLTNAHTNSLGGGMNAESGGAGSLTYRIENNSVTGAVGTAIVTGKLWGGGKAGEGSAVGTIAGNTIGSAAASSASSAGSGIDVSVLGDGKHSAQILNNTIREYSQHGILATAGGGSRSTTGLAHNAAFNLTLTGNTIGPPAAAPGSTSSGFQLIGGTNHGNNADLPDQYQVCLNLNNNTFGSAGDETNAAGRDYVLRQRFETAVRLPGYTGPHAGTSADMTTALTNYLKPRDLTPDDAFSAFASTEATEYDAPEDDGFFNTAGGAACPTN